MTSTSSMMHEGVRHPVLTPPGPRVQSPLLGLPTELRLQIYEYLWLDYGLIQHILAFTPNAYLASFPCILSAEELDQEPGPVNNGGATGALWCMHRACLKSWSNKWGPTLSGAFSACIKREGSRSSRPNDLRSNPVLAVFLVCKLVYEEASESLYSRVRFSFGSSVALKIFLDRVPQWLAARVRFIDIVAADLLYNAVEDPPDDRPYPQKVYEIVKESFPKLLELRMTLHPKDWYDAGSQSQDLEPLYQLAREMESLRRFEVYLPTKDFPSIPGFRTWVRPGEVPSSLRDAPFTAKAVPPGFHELRKCMPFNRAFSL